MQRIRIQLPASFSSTFIIPIRITDLNYGGHVGNDTILSLVHEARIQFLQERGYTELQLAGVGLIMADAGIEYKSELFYGDKVIASVAAGEMGRFGFDMFYKLEKEMPGTRQLVAVAKTGMICYDYANKKVVALPEEAAARLSTAP